MKILITGGAGFIGCNAASRYLKRGDQVVVVDNLSRDGAAENLRWLREQGLAEFIDLDIRDADGVARLLTDHRDADCVLHLAAQVAVTTSVLAPRHDFEINALGTLNVLEGMRQSQCSAKLLYASTNKVYGEMPDVTVVETEGEYAYASLQHGIAEDQNLDFHSPYGCSKGAADQYVIDYHRIYGLRTVVFRQSCIYGYRQFGIEDQGWVAWFMIASQLGLPITVYGDGKQVRDVLFVDDLLDAYDAAFAAGDSVAGRAYNIGGGPSNALSVLAVLQYIERTQNRRLDYHFGDWRPGDQKIYISDIRRAQAVLGWTPRVSFAGGIRALCNWVSENKNLFLKSFVTHR